MMRSAAPLHVCVCSPIVQRPESDNEEPNQREMKIVRPTYSIYGKNINKKKKNSKLKTLKEHQKAKKKNDFLANRIRFVFRT